jgi:hypothetical protein
MTNKIRLLVAASLIVAALLSAVFVLFAPEWANEAEESLANIAEGGARVKLSIFAFTLSQLPLMIGIAGVGAWLYRASPKLVVIGTTLAILSGFGHAVFGGAMLVQVLMAPKVDHGIAYAELADDIQSAPLLMPFMIAGVLGLVLGLILLGIAHFRSKAGPRWVGPALWAFVIVEFVGTGLSEFAAYLAALLFVSAFVGLAVGVSREESDKAYVRQPHAPV